MIIRCDFTRSGECAGNIPDACICGHPGYQLIRRVDREHRERLAELDHSADEQPA